MKDVCPLRCRLHPGGRASAPGQVDWAGLPINLDLAFSREQRDKVYVQHVMRKQRSQLSPWLHDGAQPCVCELAAQDGILGQDAAESMSSR
jgi:hypothetical protein